MVSLGSASPRRKLSFCLGMTLTLALVWSGSTDIPELPRSGKRSALAGLTFNAHQLRLRGGEARDMRSHGGGPGGSSHWGGGRERRKYERRKGPLYQIEVPQSPPLHRIAFYARDSPAPVLLLALMDVK